MINYRYNEDEILDDIKHYIDATYSQHYSRNKFQASEFIIDSGHELTRFMVLKKHKRKFVNMREQFYPELNNQLP